jgi:hypothetical protein
MKKIKCMICNREWYVYQKNWDNGVVEEVLSIIPCEHPNDHIPE